MRLKLLLCPIAALAMPADAQTIISFNQATPGNSYAEQGYVFQAAPGASFRVLSDSGSRALQGPNPFSPPFTPRFTLSREDGAAFSFLSLVIFQGDSNGLGVPLSFTGQTDSETINFTYMLPSFGRGTATPDTRTLIQLPTSFSNIRSVSWQDGAIWHQFDDVAVAALSSSVPEPSAWAFMILGFGAIGGAMRSRRSVRPAVRSASS